MSETESSASEREWTLCRQDDNGSSIPNWTVSVSWISTTAIDTLIEALATLLSPAVPTIESTPKIPTIAVNLDVNVILHSTISQEIDKS